jgi:predicted ArsR family transcriptional regulator
MNQLSLTLAPPAPRARRRDPATSHEAAASAAPLQARHHGVIVDALRAHGPMGKDQIAGLTGLMGVAVARRMAELRAIQLVRPTGRRVQSASGRAETEWEAA